MLAAFNRKKCGRLSNAFRQLFSMGDRNSSIGGTVNQECGFFHASRTTERIGSPMVFFLERPEARFQYGLRVRIVAQNLLQAAKRRERHRAGEAGLRSGGDQGWNCHNRAAETAWRSIRYLPALAANRRIAIHRPNRDKKSLLLSKLILAAKGSPPKSHSSF